MTAKKKFNLTDVSSANPLLILDLANNHNGSLSHGKRIVDEMARALEGFEFKTAIKFQYRKLPDFIHSRYQNRRDLKYVDRFLSTKLSWDDFHDLRNYIRDAGFLAACTPFDEYSVEMVQHHEFDILKIASASFTDWSLLEAISNWTGPIIGSTAGVSMEDIDRVVTFLRNRNKEFGIMHCVAAYPTSDHELLLSRIRELRSRYDNVPIGYSTHEAPGNMMAGPLALASGAVILERHVGSAFGGTTLNGYSSDQQDLRSWVTAIRSSIEMLGVGKEDSSNQTEIESLRALRRYAFSARTIKAGENIDFESVFFAIPGQEGQYQANDLGKYVEIKATRDIRESDPLTIENAILADRLSRVEEIRDKVLIFVNKSGVQFPKNQILELSHHYGLEQYDEFGIAMVTIVNFDYCKKLLILLPGQKHPAHFHKVKHETFFILHGAVQVSIDRQLPSTLNAGDTLQILPGETHEFWSDSGAIIEELSTKHSPDDSYYLDELITKSTKRKTNVTYWMPTLEEQQ
jgi:sialic acid synthase SpsE/mannose-6-phosphate isomerase-like protein (cupin superfamily)